MRIVGIAEVIIQFKDTGDSKLVLVSDLEEPNLNSKTFAPHPDALSPKKLAVAEKRLEIIRPILNGRVSTSEVESIAKKNGKSARTIYRWVADYQAHESRASLAPKHGKTKASRLSNEVEAIIQTAIENEYLSTQKRSPQKVIDSINLKCRAAGLKNPDHKTIRRRIANISPKKATRARRGKKAELDLFEPAAGEFPGATYPLAVVQIDHHNLDLILVDDKSRLPIGRAWLTLAIDVFSRMVVGYYLSLEAPSAQSVGMCVRNAILAKDQELSDLGIQNRWDVWGKMTTLHADNGKDFRSNTVTESCLEHGISIEWRPVKTPNWGGRIERLFGTIAKEFHALPGTTFSNVRSREGYDSDAESAMTFKEAQRWLLLWITGVYHERKHSELNASPKDMWGRGILGDGRKMKGIGIPPKYQDSERLRIDFLPYKECTIQRHGITLDHVRYYSDEIRHWIGHKIEGRSSKFKIRRDPLDISSIYFLDPERQAYVKVPYLDISLPTITLWELRAARSELKRRGEQDINESIIFRTIEEMDKVIDSAKSETKKVRRTRQRLSEAKRHRKNNSSKISVPVSPLQLEHTTSQPDLRVVVNNKTSSQIKSDDNEEYYEFSDEELNSGWHEWT